MSGNDEHTKLLLHFDMGTVVESALGGTAKNFVNGGQLCHTAGWFKFGEGALLCYGVDGNLTVQPSADFRLGSGPFILEGWFRSVSSPYLFCWYSDAQNYFAIEHLSTVGMTCRLRLKWVVNGIVVFMAEDASYVNLLNAFHHVAVIRENADLALYVDGEPYAAGLLPAATYPINLQGWPLYIGRGTQAEAGTLKHLTGAVDEFRVHTAIPPALAGQVGTGSFTVPSRPYAKRCRSVARGIHQVYGSAKQIARGVYHLSLFPRRQVARGSHTIYAPARQVARGTHVIYTACKQVARGVYALHDTQDQPLRHRRQVARGTYVIRAACKQVTRGKYAILTGPFKQVARGKYRLLHRCRQVARGQYDMKRGCRQVARGIYAIEEAEDAYELYYGNGAEPDLDGSPWETFASLPHETAAISGAGKHYFVLRARNKWGLCSRNLESRVIELDASDQAIPLVPGDPREIAADPAAGGAIRVRANYLPEPDGTHAADQWYLSINVPGSGWAYETIAMVKVGGVTRLDWTSGAYGDALTITVLVQTQQSGAGGRKSTNSATVEVTTSTGGPDGVSPRAYQRRAGRVIQVG